MITREDLRRPHAFHLALTAFTTGTRGHLHEVHGVPIPDLPHIDDKRGLVEMHLRLHEADAPAEEGGTDE